MIGIHQSLKAFDHQGNWCPLERWRGGRQGRVKAWTFWDGLTPVEDQWVGSIVITFLQRKEKGHPVIKVEDVWVEPDWRGEGLGKQLLEHVLALYPAHYVEGVFIGHWWEWAMARVEEHNQKVLADGTITRYGFRAGA